MSWSWRVFTPGVLYISRPWEARETGVWFVTRALPPFWRSAPLSVYSDRADVLVLAAWDGLEFL